MIKVFILAILFAITLSIDAAHAASDGRYQFTGVITSIDGEMITVKKNDKETWTFFAEPGKVTVKVGDKVTVNYKMQVQSIESKASKKSK